MIAQSIKLCVILTILSVVIIVLTTQGVLSADVSPTPSDTHPPILIGNSATQLVTVPSESFVGNEPYEEFPETIHSSKWNDLNGTQSSQDKLQQFISKITTINSIAPMYVQGWPYPANEIHAQTSKSRLLIDMDAFRADPRFAAVDGQGLAVVILDTGIDLDHPYFGLDNDNDGVADRIVFNQDFTTDGDPDAQDVNGHGSNVSGIIASEDAIRTGMCPGVDIIHLQVLDDGGGGKFGWLETALQWVINNHAFFNIAAVNMSLSDGENWSVTSSRYGIGDELATLAAADIIIGSAAGNNFYPFNSVQGVGYPAADPNSLAVSAVYDSGTTGYSYLNGAQAFSSGPDRITPFSQKHITLTDVFAPGAPITNAGPTGNRTTYHGTSQAAPHITGIAVLAQQLAEQHLGRRLTVDEFRQLLRDTGATIHDGDDEDDNVVNTNLNFQRVDMLALAEAILAMATCPGDFDEDGDIDGSDFWAFTNNFANRDPEADLNQDGLINSGDLQDFAENFGEFVCP